MSYTPCYKTKDEKYLMELVLDGLPQYPCQFRLKDLYAYTGVKERDIRFIIQKLRQKGYPICSTPEDGYWMAQHSTDLNDTIAKMESHWVNMTLTINSLMEARKELASKERMEMHEHQ